MRETEGRISFETTDNKNEGRHIVFTLQTTTFTMYSRIFGQEVQTITKFSTNDDAFNHHEVLTIYPAVRSSRSTHVLLLLLIAVVG